MMTYYECLEEAKKKLEISDFDVPVIAEVPQEDDKVISYLRDKFKLEKL